MEWLGGLGGEQIARLYEKMSGYGKVIVTRERKNLMGKEGAQ